MFSISPGLTFLSSLQITPMLALGWLNIFWGFLAVLLVILCLALIMIILIQDPKGGGLASAFGAGPSGESLLGAQAQQEITRITGWMTGILMVVVLTIVLIDNHSLIKQSAAEPKPNAQSNDSGTGAPPKVPAPAGDDPGPNAPKAPPPGDADGEADGDAGGGNTGAGDGEPGDSDN